MSVIRFLSVHGISDMILKGNYAIELETKIFDNLKKLKVVPEHLRLEAASDIITFDQVNYSTYGHAAEERVVEAYEASRQKLYNFADKFLDAVVLDKLRRTLITAVSDVMVYQSEVWREQIRDEVLKKITPYIGVDKSITVLGHSLGSVVAFDVCYFNSRHNKVWNAANFKPTNLFTMGSPVAVFSLELDDQTGTQKPRYYPADATPPNADPTNTVYDMEPMSNQGVWYNFLDAQDLIGYPLQELFENKFRVQDFLVQTGTNPLTAHARYWQNDEVAERIAERLKMDYERLTK